MTISRERLAIFAADVGAVPKGNFGWACKWGDEEDGGDSIEKLADAIVRVARNGGYVSLGFECPLFIPCPVKEADLGKQREGESREPWPALWRLMCLFGVFPRRESPAPRPYC